LAEWSDVRDELKQRLFWRIGRELRLAGRILDLGCGAPDLHRYLAKTYRQRVTGVETALGELTARRDCSPGGLVRCIRGVASRLHYFVRDSSKDAVVMMWTLHRAKQPLRVLEEAYRVLRPGGEIVIVDFLQGAAAERLCRVDYFRPEEVRGLLKKTAFCDTDVQLIEQEQIIWARGFRPPESPLDAAARPDLQRAARLSEFPETT